MPGPAVARMDVTGGAPVQIAEATDLILRSIANGSRECAPDDRLRDASRRIAAKHGLAAILRDAAQRARPSRDNGEAVARG
jgi:hypothetical protein